LKEHRKLFFLLVPALIVLDQATKAWVRAALPLPDSGRTPKVTVVPGFFNLVHARNPGAAWGLLGEHEYRLVFFTIVTLVAFVVILGYYRQLRPADRVLAIGLSSIFAGAAGNFIDRLIFREVTDFLQFYASGGIGRWLHDTLGSRYWPAFNVADICINVGVGLFILHVLFLEGRGARAGAGANAGDAGGPAAAAGGGGDEPAGSTGASAAVPVAGALDGSGAA
jgi:signal peptidase II